MPLRPDDWALYRHVDSLLASSEHVSDLPNQCVAAKSL